VTRATNWHPSPHWRSATKVSELRNDANLRLRVFDDEILLLVSGAKNIQ
jgi:hypothetical protein